MEKTRKTKENEAILIQEASEPLLLGEYKELELLEKIVSHKGIFQKIPT